MSSQHFLKQLQSTIVILKGKYILDNNDKVFLFCLRILVLRYLEYHLYGWFK